MKIGIFYHIYQLTYHPNLSKEYWIKMYNEQINALKESDLYHACDFIQLGINGNDPVENFSDKIKVAYNNPSDKGESGTLKLIKDFCLKEENQDYKILYFHQKGITRIEGTEDVGRRDKDPVHAWRLYMEYFNIHRWMDCVEALSEYDCCGVDYQEDTFLGKFPHFSGNFWWGNASYIKTLDHSYLDDREHMIGKMLNYVCKEFWIGSGPNVKAKCLHQSGVVGGLYGTVYGPENYMNK